MIFSMQRHEKLVSEIGKINVRNTLVYYLLWKIDSLDELHDHSRRKRRNPAFFDIRSHSKIVSFVKECIEIYNNTHSHGAPWTFTEMIYFLKFVWQKETKDYLDAKSLANKL